METNEYAWKHMETGGNHGACHVRLRADGCTVFGSGGWYCAYELLASSGSTPEKHHLRSVFPPSIDQPVIP